MDYRSNSSEDEYEENQTDILNIRCLFCSVSFGTFENILVHIKENHQLDFIDKCRTFNLDIFQFFKLINYIRKNEIKSTEVEAVLESKSYNVESYMIPTLEDDHFLMFDFEGEDSITFFENKPDIEDTGELNFFCDFENYYKNLPKEKLIMDLFRIKMKYEEASKFSNSLKDFIRKTIVDDTENLPKKGVINLDNNSDIDYINSYSHFGIHHTMLSDKERTLAYKDAIIENSEAFLGKSVLDIGCGTGILSLFAAQAGARIVVAVDQSDIIDNATMIIQQNGYENVIKTVKGKLETIDWKLLNLPTQYDIIISEWMGYFLLFEGMIDTVLFARDNLMTNEGKLLPNRSKMFFAAFSDSNFYEKNVDFWNDVYGFKMSSFIKDVTSEAMVEVVNGENICSSSEVILELDISKCSIESALQVNSKFSLRFEQTATIHGFVGWFDCYFEGMFKSVTLSTSPFSESTHWKQTIFLLKEPISIEAGKSLKGEIEILRDTSNARALNVGLYLEQLNMSLQYNISC